MKLSTIEPTELVGVEAELYEKACDLHKTYTALGGRYREIVKFVREHSLPPERVDLILCAAGFNKQRASDIRRICATDDDTAAHYLKGRIGFRAVVELEREKSKSKKKGSARTVSVTSRRKQALWCAFQKYCKLPSPKGFLSTCGKFAMVVVDMEQTDVTFKAASGVEVSTKELHFANYVKTTE